MSEDKEKKSKAVEPESEMSTSEIKKLLEVILQREARIAAKEQEEAEQVKTKQLQRERNAQNNDDGLQSRQRTCTHLKGGVNGPLGKRDFAVYMHTFVNLESIIRCFLCRAKWKNGVKNGKQVNPPDSREFIYRNGKQMPNPTRLGWDDAVQMLRESTNQPSSTEIPPEAFRIDQATTTEL